MGIEPAISPLDNSESGGADSNRRPSRWQRDILPLNYHRENTFNPEIQNYYANSLQKREFLDHSHLKPNSQ